MRVPPNSGMVFLPLAIVLIGCHAPKKHLAEVPGCKNAQIYVPKECYSQTINGAVEVRCPDGSTTTYRCNPKDAHAQR